MRIFIKNVSIFLIFSLLFILPGCSSSSKELGPSPLDPYWEAKNRTFPSKKFRSPMGWAAGQYIVVGYLKNGNKDKVEKTTIIRKDKGGWVDEVITTDKKGKITGIQKLNGFEYVKKGNETVKMTWMKMLRDDGTVERIEQEIPEMPPEFEGYKNMFGKFMPSKQEDKIVFVDGLPVTVPAGIFKGTTIITTEKTLQAGKKTAKIYMYPDVPINGIVKMAYGMIKTANEDENVSMELLDFGKNGKPFICTCTRTDRHINHDCEKKK